MTEQIPDKVKEKEQTDYNPLSKVLSGRFILTIVGAISFLVIVNSICTLLISKSQEIKASDIQSILGTLLVVLSNIFTFYFVRKGMEGKG